MELMARFGVFVGMGGINCGKRWGKGFRSIGFPDLKIVFMIVPVSGIS